MSFCAVCLCGLCEDEGSVPSSTERVCKATGAHRSEHSTSPEHWKGRRQHLPTQVAHGQVKAFSTVQTEEPTRLLQGGLPERQGMNTKQKTSRRAENGSPREAGLGVQVSPSQSEEPWQAGCPSVGMPICLPASPSTRPLHPAASYPQSVKLGSRLAGAHPSAASLTSRCFHQPDSGKMSIQISRLLSPLSPTQSNTNT